MEYQPVEDDSISSEIHDHIHHKTTCYPKMQIKLTKIDGTPPINKTEI